MSREQLVEFLKELFLASVMVFLTYVSLVMLFSL